MQFHNITLHLVSRGEEPMFKGLMQKHHYPGWLPKIGNTIWYVAIYQGKWHALLIFSAVALKCRARDQWIGWDYRHQYDRLNLIANNSRFLILPGKHKKIWHQKYYLCVRKGFSWIGWITLVSFIVNGNFC